MLEGAASPCTRQSATRISHRTALRGHANDVMHGGAAAARNHADDSRQLWKRTLAPLVEQPLGLELLTQLAKLRRQVTFACESRGARDQLELPPSRIQRERSAEANPCAIFERRLRSPHIRLEHDAAQLSRVFFVVEREIHVSFGAPHIGELAFDQYVRPLVLERDADGAVDFGHAEYTFIPIMAFALKTLEERHLRHAGTVAAIKLAKKGPVLFSPSEAM